MQHRKTFKWHALRAIETDLRLAGKIQARARAGYLSSRVFRAS
jgi:hypothetical protein